MKMINKAYTGLVLLKIAQKAQNSNRLTTVTSIGTVIGCMCYDDAIPETEMNRQRFIQNLKFILNFPPIISNCSTRDKVINKMTSIYEDYTLVII